MNIQNPNFDDLFMQTELENVDWIEELEKHREEFTGFMQKCIKEKSEQIDSSPLPDRYAQKAIMNAITSIVVSITRLFLKEFPEREETYSIILDGIVSLSMALYVDALVLQIIREKKANREKEIEDLNRLEQL